MSTCSQTAPIMILDLGDIYDKMSSDVGYVILHSSFFCVDILMWNNKNYQKCKYKIMYNNSYRICHWKHSVENQWLYINIHWTWNVCIEWCRRNTELTGL